MSFSIGDRVRADIRLDGRPAWPQFTDGFVVGTIVKIKKYGDVVCCDIVVDGVVEPVLPEMWVLDENGWCEEQYQLHRKHVGCNRWPIGVHVGRCEALELK